VHVALPVRRQARAAGCLLKSLSIGLLRLLHLLFMALLWPALALCQHRSAPLAA
jgi:hypothetical protein